MSVNAFNTFHNARFTNAVTSVRAGELGRGSIGRDNIVRANQGDLARAGAIHGQLPMTPSHESTRFSDRAASSQGLPRTSDSMRFASHMQTPATNRMSFEQQRQGFSQGISRSASNGNGGNSGGVNSAVRSGGAPTGGANSSGSSAGGWQRFDPSANRGRVNAGPNGGNLGASRAAGSIGNNGASNGQGNSGYRGYSGSSSGVQQGPQGGRPMGPGSQPGYQQQGHPGYQQPQSRPGYSQPTPRSYTPQQPVHINPPIVQNRGGSGGSNSGGSRPSGGGGGGSHPSGGGAWHSSGGGHHR